MARKTWKRLLGVSKQQGKLSRKIGVPLSAAGRRRKYGSGCAVVIAAVNVAMFIACAGGNQSPVANPPAVTTAPSQGGNLVPDAIEPPRAEPAKPDVTRVVCVADGVNSQTIGEYTVKIPYAAIGRADLYRIGTGKFVGKSQFQHLKVIVETRYNGTRSQWTYLPWNRLGPKAFDNLGAKLKVGVDLPDGLRAADAEHPVELKPTAAASDFIMIAKPSALVEYVDIDIPSMTSDTYRFRITNGMWKAAARYLPPEPEPEPEPKAAPRPVQITPTHAIAPGPGKSVAIASQSEAMELFIAAEAKANKAATSSMVDRGLVTIVAERLTVRLDTRGARFSYVTPCEGPHAGKQVVVESSHLKPLN